MGTDRLVAVVGTRPEAIKLAPVVEVLRLQGKRVHVVFTGQHGEGMLPDLVDFPVYDVDARSLPPLTFTATNPAAIATGLLTSRLSEYFGILLDGGRWSGVVVQGDTASAYAGAVAGSLSGLPVVHLEAGLRSDGPTPWPEDLLRRAIAPLAWLHLAPSEEARDNLLREGVRSASVQVVGNPGFDSLDRITAANWSRCSIPQPFALMTLHRRELIGAGQDVVANVVCGAVNACRARGMRLVVVRHPSSAHLLPLLTGGDGLPAPDMAYLEPQPYREMCSLLVNAAVVVTDSGGLQEDAAQACVPCVTVREHSERRSLSQAPWGVQVSPFHGSAAINDAFEAALSTGMATHVCPWGGGGAGLRAANAIDDWLNPF